MLQFKKTSRTRLTFLGSFLSTFVLLLQIAVSFYLMPFVISSLGERLYGVWRIIGSFVGYYGLLDFGISAAVMRFVARSIGKENRHEIKLYVGSAFWMLSAIGILIIIITVAIYYVGFICIKSYEDARLFSLSALILGIGIGISFPFRVFTGVLNANLRFDLSRYIEIGEILVKTIFIIVFLKKGYGIIGLAFAVSLPMLCRYLMQTLLAFKIEAKLRIGFGSVRMSKAKEIGEYGIFSFLQSLTQLLRSGIDPLVIGMFINVTTVTFYGVALSLIEYLTHFFYSSLGVLFPVFSEKDGASDFEAIANSLEFLTRITTIVSTFLGALTILYAKSFLIRWLGPQFEISYIYVLILGLPFVFSFGFLPCSMVLNTTGKHRAATWIELAHGCSNLIISIILVNFLGAIGVACGTAIPAFVFVGFIIPFYGCRRVGLNFWLLCAKMFFTALGCLSLIAPVWFIWGSSVGSSYSSILKIVVVHLIVFGSIGYFVLLPKRDKQRLKELKDSLFGKEKRCQM